MMSIGQALREIVPCFEPLGAERKALLDALGSVLAEDVHAPADLPGFDNSAMDGYAVRRAELALGRELPVYGESRAGGAWPPALPGGAAMRVFTGAPLPEGADTVVIQENARVRDGRVAFEPLPARGAHVRARGADLAAGSLALERGQRLFAGEIGLLAALGLPSASVYLRPRVAILSTGDELRELGQPTAPGTIAESNAYALAAQLLELGADPWLLPIARDRVDDIAEKLALGLRADAVLCCGGVSVGDYDLMGDALARAGIAVKLWKVAVKPGKPLMFATAGRVPVVGLPGNPVSAMVGFELFVKPGLRRMLGFTQPYPELIEVELEHAHRHATGRVELARAVLRPATGARMIASLHRLQGSGSLPSMCGADALVVLDAEVEHFARGCVLRALQLRWERGQAESPFA